MASSAVVGMLRVLLSANVAEFEAGMKRGADVAKQTGKAIEGAGLQSSKSAKYFNDLAVQVKTNALAFVSATAAMGAITGVLRTTIGEFINLTGKLTDVSAQTGIAVDELQRLKYAGDLVGVSLDQITTAVGQLQNRLAGGDEGALAALRQLKLTWDDLKAQDPGKILEDIAEQIAKIPDPAMRTHLAMELFGRSGAQLLPLFRTNLKEVGDEAERIGVVMSGDVVSAGDKLGDLWTKLKAVAVALTAEGLRPLLDQLQDIPRERNKVEDFFVMMFHGIRNVLGVVVEADRWINNLTASIKRMPTIKPSQSVANLFGEKALKAIQLTDQELKDVYATLAEGLETSKKANAEAERHAAAIRQMVDAYKGTTAIKAAQDALEALTIAAKDGVMIAEMSQRQQDAINGIMAEAVEVYRRLGREAPPAIKAVYLATLDLAKLSIPAVRGLSDEFARLGREIELVMDPDPLPVIRGLGKEFGKVGTVIELETIPRLRTFQEILTQTLSDVPRLIQQALTGGGGFKGAAEALLSGLGSAFSTKGFGALFQRLGGSITSTFGKLFTGIGGALGAAIGPLVDVLADVFHDERWEKVTRDVGRDWGVNISEGLARAIADESKRIGSRGDAPLLFLKEIFGEAGGIEAFGLDKAIKKTRDLFSAIDRGSLNNHRVA